MSARLARRPNDAPSPSDGARARGMTVSDPTWGSLPGRATGQAIGHLKVARWRRNVVTRATGMDLTGQLSNPPEPLARLLSIVSRSPAETKHRRPGVALEE